MAFSFRVDGCGWSAAEFPCAESSMLARVALPRWAMAEPVALECVEVFANQVEESLDLPVSPRQVAMRRQLRLFRFDQPPDLDAGRDVASRD